MASKSRANKIKHNKLTRSVIEAINVTNVALVWKMQSGLFKTWRNEPAGKIGIPGVPDICGIAKDGRFLGIEIKVLPDKLNPDQIDFQKFCDDVNAIYIVFTDRADINDLIELLKRVRHPRSRPRNSAELPIF